ncbi:AAA domain-containing protein, partial [Acinetobacter seifertii]|uniref:AAA domain-containing protein n=1 Tax=Acinetobacter seifertii TaxID=1530123 RepID=UPI001580E613
MELSANVENYQKYDNELVALQRKQIASNAASVSVPSGVASGRVSDLTELSLIEKEASKKTRHIPIRSLLERAPNAIQALKPCFMMSPMSVAQYLKPGLFDFDLVVMDEASQILPEDAIGALARGKSAIIVGDPKQLPPTSFFSTSINLDEVNEDELVGVEDAESILDSVSMFKKRRLRWHYRSRHQSLIAFSNKHFYDSDLVLFPSPIQSSPELGIRFKRVSGTFNSGRNCEEAQFVVDEVCELILQDKDESIGIVAMNSQQRDEIEHQLELRLAQSTFLQELYDKKMKSHEPVFIKNLENVQGDERDVIVISMTYGPSQIGGKVFQRFGPINQASGWRRLNVLFTRSKKRMHIISSMSSSDILSSESSSKGVSALKAFLRYCETGFLHEEKITGKAPDSDFEIAVMKALADYGYDCEPQLGVAGYFLDLAVKNPDNPGEYLIAVECDGATYHSAKSSRDRDRLRQQILESLGWNIHRIWSTDWFKNSQEQMQILLEKLQKIRPVIENHNIDSDI